MRHAAVRGAASRNKDERASSGGVAPDALARVTELYRQGRHQDALHLASAALRNDPADARLWNVSAGAAFALGLREDAERFWKVAVARDPAFAEPHYNLGVVHFEDGKFEAAALSLSRAVLLQPDNAWALNNLAAVLAELRRFDEAVRLLRQSITLDPANAQAHHNLGLSLMELGLCAEAQSCFERAIELRPGFAEALTSRATLCLQEGDDESAERFLDKALAGDPSNGTAHLIRALQRRVTPSAWVEQLRSAYRRRAGRPSKDLIDLDFAMGKACEDLGEYDAAFEAYAEGNRLHYARRPYDEARDERFVEKMISAFGADLYGEDAVRPRPVDPRGLSRMPIFIVGMPRSGTSLLEQTLATHPEVHGAGELTLLDEILAPFPIDVPPPGARRAWLERLRALGNEYLDRAWTAEVREHVLIDKMPSNYQYLGLLPLMIPGAKLIHMTRDPMDTCYSCFVTPFAHGHEYAFDQHALGRHYLRYRRLMDHWRGVLPPGWLFEVSYEGLVADFEGEVRRVLAHAGLSWHEGCTRFYENKRVVRTASRVQVREPIHSRSVARWRRFERHLQPLLQALAPVLRTGVTGSTV